jgi:hypothetical protein
MKSVIACQAECAQYSQSVGATTLLSAISRASRSTTSGHLCTRVLEGITTAAVSAELKTKVLVRRIGRLGRLVCTEPNSISVRVLHS